MRVQIHLLCCHPDNGDMGRGRWPVGSIIVIYLYPPPSLFDKGCIERKKGLDCRSGLQQSLIPVPVEEVLDASAQRSGLCLVARWYPAEGDPSIHCAPYFLRNPGCAPTLRLMWLGNRFL